MTCYNKKAKTFTWMFARLKVSKCPVDLQL